MSATAGGPLSGDAHLAQSIGDILSTPIGSRVMRRDYGSALLDLIDAPFNALTRLRYFAAIASSLQRWEPRLRLTRVEVGQDAPGALTVTVEGERTDRLGPDSYTRLTMPLRLGAAAA